MPCEYRGFPLWPGADRGAPARLELESMKRTNGWSYDQGPGQSGQKGGHLTRLHALREVSRPSAMAIAAPIGAGLPSPGPCGGLQQKRTVMRTVMRFSIGRDDALGRHHGGRGAGP